MNPTSPPGNAERCRRTADSVWSFTIVAIVLTVIWAGYSRRIEVVEPAATETAVKGETLPIVEAPPAETEIVAPPLPEPATLDYPPLQSVPEPVH